MADDGDDAIDTQPLEQTTYDVIVLGTGLVESIVAGALARVGKRVLHLDANAFYGQSWATLSLAELRDLALAAPPAAATTTTTIDADADADAADAAADEVALDCPSDDAHRVLEDAEVVVTDENEDAVDALFAQSRAFNVDVQPMLLLSRGAMVDALVRSGVGRYVEFRLLSGIYMLNEPAEEGAACSMTAVPTSQHDVFGNDAIGLVEKRLLTKLLKFCHAYDPDAADDGGGGGAGNAAAAAIDGAALADARSIPLFVDFVARRRLPPALQDVVFYAVAQLGADQRAGGPARAATRDGLRRVREHLHSLGRYGRGASLYPLYGTSELVQSFCRLCAVYAGTYVLRRGARRVLLRGGAFAGVVDAAGQRLAADALVVGAAVAPAPWTAADAATAVSRCVCVLDGPLVPGEGAARIVAPPRAGGGAGPVAVLQLDHRLSVCPAGRVVAHLTTPAAPGRSAREDLEPVLRAAVRGAAQPPRVLWAAYFRVRAPGGAAGVPPNVAVCPGPDADGGIDRAVDAARAAFARVAPPGAEFLPPPPPPPSDAGEGEDEEEEEEEEEAN